MIRELQRVVHQELQIEKDTKTITTRYLEKTKKRKKNEKKDSNS